MAVYRKCYYRRRAVNASCIFFTITSNWTIIFSLCLNMMLCGTISCTFNERVRHHHWPVQDEATVPHLMAKSSGHHQQEENGSKQPLTGCPDCQAGRSVKAETDMLRIEAIKRQILSKLGLRQKPNVTHSLPREVVMETLFRAEDSSDFFSNFYREENFSTTSARTSTPDTMEYDDFYGRTSEIISFAEEGSSINSNRVLEFGVSPDSGEFGQDFKVRTATLWMKADITGHRTPQKCRTKLYVFKIISKLPLPDTIQITQQQFQKMTSGSDPVPSYLEESNSGWQKIDLTNIVRTWLSESSKEKLRLLVDCSCCSNWHIHLFNNEVDKRSNVNRPFLVIHTDPNTAKRVRRRALDCSPDSGNQCCKQRFYVSFKAIGWDDWIIAPQGYYANYCRGDCGHHRTPDTFVTYHAHVLEEVQKTHHLSGIQPCCAPLKFSSMSLIYYGYDNNIIKRDLPKMVVDECGCP